MKILWIEDFGGNQSSEEELSKAIFKTILSKSDEEITRIYTDYEPDSGINSELPKLFKENSIHEIVICRTFKYWNDNIKTTFDFDVVLIDINLAKGSSPDDIPQGYEDNLHNKAGFYIYQEIIKFGLPDDNIAFFTGETGSFQGFKKSCISNSIPFPKNVFEKKDDDYKKIGDWLKNKSEMSYFTLRRGIIEACKYLKTETQSKSNADYVLFNKTIKEKKTPLSKDYITEYLTKLELFLPMNPPKDRKVIFYRFVREMAVEWEMSYGNLKNKDKDGKFIYRDKIEFNFKNFCQNQMKLLRNWTAHNQISKNISEKEVAFYFMIAMRALFNLSIKSEIYLYEKNLFQLFELKEYESLQVEQNLAKSYFKLRKSSIFEYKNPTENKFNSLVESLGKFIKDEEEFIEVESISIDIFYQNFWHSLFPSNTKVKDQSSKQFVVMYIDFKYKDLNNFPFLTKLAKSIYSEAFGDLK